MNISGNNELAEFSEVTVVKAGGGIVFSDDTPCRFGVPSSEREHGVG